MHIEDDRSQTLADTDVLSRVTGMESGLKELMIQLATVMARLTGVDADLGALKTGLCIAETRLAGVENRQRHSESRRERHESRFTDIDYGVDRVQSDMATIKDRVRCVELDLRELTGTLHRGPMQGGQGALGPLNQAVSCPVGFKES